MKTIRFTLPTAAQWDSEHCMASGLRYSSTTGLKPVGSPLVLTNPGGAGAFCFRMPSGKVLTTSDDRHDLYINGSSAGSLPAPLLAVLPDGTADDCMLFTSDGTCWLSNGQVQAELSTIAGAISLTAQDASGVTEEVDAPELRGDYQRTSGTLTDDDCARAARCVTSALTAAEQAAAGFSTRVQPALVAWQLKDAAGNVIFRSAPVWLSHSGGVQGTGGCSFTLTVESGAITACSSSRLQLGSYKVSLSVTAVDSAFWRGKAALLEVVATPPLVLPATGATGRFDSVSSAESSLSVALTGVDAASIAAAKEQMVREFASRAVVVARVANPLAGADITVGASALSGSANWTADNGEIHASAAYRGGTLVAYADNEHPGVLVTAAAESPLVARGRSCISSGRIWRITGPVGSNGGWNYGRHHLLCISSDGIYAVSVERSLQTLSAAMLVDEGVARADAVAVAHNCVYCATTSGRLLRLRGARADQVSVPIRPVALGWCADTSELWMADEYGTTLTLDRDGGLSLRPDCRAAAFFPKALCVDKEGRLRDLAQELTFLAEIEWRRRFETDICTGMMEWRIASPRVEGLKLALLADGGGAPQTVVALDVTGALNAPLRLRRISPVRPYLTVSIAGKASAATRLTSVGL